MVVLLDMDAQEPYQTANDFNRYVIAQNRRNISAQSDDGERDESNRPNPNLRNKFSEAMACYPIVTLLAQGLDLNSLHDLSRTCRQVRANLLEYRRQLISQTLRCFNEDEEPGSHLGKNSKETHQNWSTFGPNGIKVPKMTSGKVGTCARDMVGQCRRCSSAVCRNCIVKAPVPTALRGRHRRLCRTCIKSPLDEHTRYVVDECCQADDSSSSGTSDEHQHTAIARDPCSCDEQVWICQPCGQSLRTHDTTYMRGWTWRTRYSTYLGGLGTGIGEGIEGVQCGRPSYCLAAKEVEKEIDCDAEELEALKQLSMKAEMEGRTWSGTSYLMQEMEGIGGVVKKKVKRRVRVGAVVKEYEDEREHGHYLRREQDGLNRSWCSWCDRVVKGKKDLEPPLDGEDLSRTVSRTSSSSSI
ncbi:hypothetical protein AAFC00_000889 [Neodothiora populina]|uniref:Uncharacterized protein n=1 Tax=Neodothiora populina TaxID=2781224 RepID=A0ABR3PMC5_9PEZI